MLCCRPPPKYFYTEAAGDRREKRACLLVHLHYTLKGFRHYAFGVDLLLLGFKTVISNN
jgi:hypothetical protein